LFVGHFVEGHQRSALMGVLTPPEQAPLEQALPEQTSPEQVPHELTIVEAMFRAFGPSSDEDDEENKGDEADEEEEDGGSAPGWGSAG
jgi:hypothetical protein